MAFGMDCMETDGSLTDSCLSLSGASCAANMLCDRLEPGPCVGAALYALGTWIHALPKGLEIFQHCGSFIPPATDRRRFWVAVSRAWATVKNRLG